MDVMNWVWWLIAAIPAVGGRNIMILEFQGQHSLQRPYVQTKPSCRQRQGTAGELRGQPPVHIQLQANIKSLFQKTKRCVYNVIQSRKWGHIT